MSDKPNANKIKVKMYQTKVKNTRVNYPNPRGVEPNPTHLKAMNKIIIACPTAEIYTAYSVRWQDIALDGAKIANTPEPIKRANVLNITVASRV